MHDNSDLSWLWVVGIGLAGVSYAVHSVSGRLLSVLDKLKQLDKLDYLRSIADETIHLPDIAKRLDQIETRTSALYGAITEKYMLLHYVERIERTASQIETQISSVGRDIDLGPVVSHLNSVEKHTEKLLSIMKDVKGNFGSLDTAMDKIVDQLVAIEFEVRK